MRESLSSFGKIIRHFVDRRTYESAFSNREVSGPFLLKINQLFEKAFCAFFSEYYLSFPSVDLSSHSFEHIFVWTDTLLFQLASFSVRFDRLE